jgi:hypothetical protein
MFWKFIMGLPRHSSGITRGSLHCFVDKQQSTAELVKGGWGWRYAIQLISSNFCNKKHIQLVLKRKHVVGSAEGQALLLENTEKSYTLFCATNRYGSVFYSGKCESVMGKCEGTKIRNCTVTLKCKELWKCTSWKDTKALFSPLWDSDFFNKWT